MKKLLIACIAMVSGYATADVGDVRLWDPAPGRAAELYQAATTAKAIHEKLGASVTIATDQDGNMHYANVFDNWESWGKFQAALAVSADWQAFFTSFGMNPPGELVATFFVNNPVVAKANNVSVVFSWDVLPGRTADMVALSQEAAAIHAKLGASAGINIDDIGNVHYELTFDSWEAWGKYTVALQNSKEWAAFIAEASQDPIAELVKVYRLDSYAGE
jgi:hypothetical protein